jgi:excisionase family DNA binding protein
MDGTSKPIKNLRGSQMPNFLTTKEVAQIFRRHPRTIYRWIDEGFLQAKKVRDGWLITQEEVERILTEADEYNENRMSSYDTL